MLVKVGRVASAISHRLAADMPELIASCTSMAMFVSQSQRVSSVLCVDGWT